jgi:glycosyltransferase involved in cell wall biosynthesis
MRIAWLNWRDTLHPEGGGSEVYMERIATELVNRGHQVTIVCAAHDRGPAREQRNGLDFWRLGSKMGVYSKARRLLRSGALGPLDVIVDTHNGVPFFSPWATSVPVVVLVHHIHREQWPVIYGPIRSRAGWWVESRLAPRVYRHNAYVTVSERTKEELADLGVASDRISVVHNGVTTFDSDRSRAPRSDNPRSDGSHRPTITVLGRLVPHKQVEHVLAAAAHLRPRIPDLRVFVVGDGWWAPHLHELSRTLDLDDVVEFTGYVDEVRKTAILQQTSVLALPSLKEGWGLVVMEAASHGVPAIAYAQAGGVAESIVDHHTGLLVGPGYDSSRFAEALETLLLDDDLRIRLGAHAYERANAFDWSSSGRAFESVLINVVNRSSGREGVSQLVEP